MWQIRIKYFYYLWLGLSISIGKIHAQNLIYNGSFELNVCPKKLSTPWPYGYSFNYGMTSETGWLNVTKTKINCNNICDFYDNEPSYGVIMGDTADTRCCGEGCVQSTVSTFKFDKHYLVQGKLSYNNNSMTNSSYLQQKLSSPLLNNHSYYFYMFYTYHLLIKSQGKMIGQYELTNKLPNITHNGFGVTFSTNQLIYDSINFKNSTHYILPSSNEQRKLRFNTSYSNKWQKLEGTFQSDSLYNYTTIGNFWRTEDIIFNPPLNQSVRSPSFIFLDSINLWDVTHHIVSDTTYCYGQKTVLESQNYSRGNTIWRNASGIVLGTSDSLPITIIQDSLIISIRYFPEIEYETTDSIWLRVKNKPLNFTLKRQGDSCKLPATLIALPNNLTYTWNGLDNGSNNYTASSPQTISVTATDSNKCTDSLSYTVIPEVNFSMSLLSDTCDDKALLNFLPSTYQYYYNNSKINNPFYTSAKGKLFVVAEQVNGCRDTQYFFIPLCLVQKDLLWIPNVFSPNHNDLNEEFAPISQYLKSYHITIYNRWGEKIFESNSTNSAWDGTYKNSPVPDGVYLYQISIDLIDNRQLYKTGVVNVLR